MAGKVTQTDAKRGDMTVPEEVRIAVPLKWGQESTAGDMTSGRAVFHGHNLHNCLSKASSPVSSALLLAYYPPAFGYCEMGYDLEDPAKRKY